MNKDDLHCPKCGATQHAGARFCRLCGGPVAAVVHPTAGSLVKDALATANTVAAGVQSVQKAAQVAEKIQSIIVRPPAKWKIVTEELLVPVGRTFVEAASAAAQQRAVSETEQKVPQPPAGTLTCAACGLPLRLGAKFCGACGAAASSGKEAAVKSFCPSCGREAIPGKKFCGSCGHKLG